MNIFIEIYKENMKFENKNCFLNFIIMMHDYASFRHYFMLKIKR